MAIHPAVRRINTRVKAKELHAARSGREVMDALALVVTESQALSISDMARDLDPNIEAILDAMPAYAPPLNVVHQIYSQFEQAQKAQISVNAFQMSVARAAETYREWTGRARQAIAGYGASLISNGDKIFTFTLSETVSHTLLEARQRGLEFRVSVTESRPNNDGLRTARLLTDKGVAVEIGIDVAIREMISKVDLMLVGAEAILSDGSAVCKVGTYPAALIAQRYKVPIYGLVDSFKFHTSSLLGKEMWLDPIELEDFGQPETGRDLAVCGHLFDRTPPELFSALVTEKGLLDSRLVSQWMLEMPISFAIANR